MTAHIWRGDPVDRRGQEVCAAELRNAYEADMDATALRAAHKATGDELNKAIGRRSAHLGLIGELRFSLEEAAKCLRASDPFFADVDLAEFIERMKRIEARGCSDCQRLTIDARRENARVSWVNCEKHQPAPVARARLLLEADEVLVLRELLSDRPDYDGGGLEVERFRAAVETLRPKVLALLPTDEPSA